MIRCKHPLIGSASLWCDLSALGGGEDIEHIVMGSESSLAQRSRLNSLHQFVPTKIEDCLKELCRILLVGLPHYEEHARAVLDIVWREQLLAQDLHDQISFAAIKAAGIATAVLLGEEGLRPLVVICPQLIKQLAGKACSFFDLISVRSRLNSV